MAASLARQRVLNFPGETPNTAAGWGEAIARLARSERILLLGPSGAGKSHLALQLAPILGLPLQHLDALFWHPGWRKSKSQSEWRTLIEELVREPRWIMDGTYERTLHLRVPAAQSIIIVERSRAYCLWRGFRRAVFLRHVPRPDAPQGERFTLPFVRYIWRYPRDTKPIIARVLADHGAGKIVIVLRTPADVVRLLRELVQRVKCSKRC